MDRESSKLSEPPLVRLEASLSLGLLGFGWPGIGMLSDKDGAGCPLFVGGWGDRKGVEELNDDDV